MATGTESSDDGGIGSDPFAGLGAISPNSGTGNAVDPASLGGNDSGDAPSGAGTNGDAPKRKRGRPAGSRNAGGNAKQKTSLDISGIEKMLLGIHTMGAIFLAAPELALSEAEAHEVAKATVNVAQYYDLTADPKTLAWVNFGFVMAGIYGSKAFVIYARKKKERAERPQPADNVIPGVFTRSPGTF